jgi:hypothetical protein
MDNGISSSEIVSDLVRIHDDRIVEYRHLLNEPDLALDIRAIFERIIEESLIYSRQLKEKLSEPQEGYGSIYKIWLSEKTPVAEKNKRMILATCATDELITNNTYSVAISMVTDEKLRQLLEEHQQGLKNLHADIRQYYHAQ